MADPLPIRVCSSCGWKHKGVRKVLKSLQAEHGARVKVTKKGCLDKCSRDPVVAVGKIRLAPAKPKRLRRLVHERLHGRDDG